MRAIGYKTPGDINVLEDIEIEKPRASKKDLLVRIKAISINPVDTKLRTARTQTETDWQVLGYDASGIVEECGEEVNNFKIGDEVFYAGDISRSGTNAEYHLVDERIVGIKPKSLSHAKAAALPLTSITAWEMLFNRLNVNNPTADGSDAILIIGGAGGVGSITIQLLKTLTNLKVIATASREESQSWVKELGADFVVNHSKVLAPQIEELGKPGFVFSTTQTDRHFEDIVELIAPQGRFGLIDDPTELNVMPLKLKAISLHWELMFTRSLFNTSDIEEQGKLLNQVSKLVDEGKIKSTLTEIAGKIKAENLKKAHEKIESGRAIGKIALEGF